MSDRTSNAEYDVVIMGAGFAGICQARHLLLNIPGLRVALVDPRPAERRDKDMKVGESMVEIASLFVHKELGLHGYMIEQHTPKQGLSFHWPKRIDKTDSLDDYYHVWVNREATIPSFHLNRAKFERDVLSMARQQGAEYVQGHVLDVDLTPGDAVKTIWVKKSDGEACKLHTKQVVDAAGRRFIIGKKTDNLIFGADHLRGVNNGAAWVRVRNVDRTIFETGPDPDNTATSRYYCTNHWFGHGHWLWQIPSCSKTMELSVGVVHHHDVIPAESLNSREKFYSFLKQNHNLLYRLVTSGKEVDFFYWPRMAHKSKNMFSEDNWYVIGDAAYMFDPFYSYGSTTIALAVESVTEIIRAKLQRDADAELKRKAYNEFNLAFAGIANVLITDHARQLGHASAMSWRVYYDYMWWFGLNVPMYIGKWHLDLPFVRAYLKVAAKIFAEGGLFDNVYETLGEVVDKNLNIGLMDVCRRDQLGNYSPLEHPDDFRRNAKTEPKKCNVFLEWKWMSLNMSRWYARLQWKVHGIRGLLQPKYLRWHIGILAMAGFASMGDFVHRIKMWGQPKNSVAAETKRQSFAYHRQRTLQPWGDNSMDAKEFASHANSHSTPHVAPRRTA